MSVSADSIRDAYALVQCSLQDDQAGHDAILACCDQGEVAGVLADTVAELFRSVSRVLSDGDPLRLLARVREALGEADGSLGEHAARHPGREAGRGRDDHLG